MNKKVQYERRDDYLYLYLLYDDEHRRDEQSMELLNKWWVKARGSNWSEIANEECVPP